MRPQDIVAGYIEHILEGRHAESLKVVFTRWKAEKRRTTSRITSLINLVETKMLIGRTGKHWLPYVSSDAEGTKYLSKFIKFGLKSRGNKEVCLEVLKLSDSSTELWMRFLVPNNIETHTYKETRLTAMVQLQIDVRRKGDHVFFQLQHDRQARLQVI